MIRGGLRPVPEPEPLRDARPAELVDEQDGVLQMLADGALPATETTRVLARQELDARRLREGLRP